MEIGLNIISSFKITIGQTFESIIDSLQTNNIPYSMPFKSEDEDGSSNAIIYISSFGVELSLKGGIVTFIKTSNSKLNYIMQIHTSSAVGVLREIRENLAKYFNISEQDIKVDRFETKTFNSIMTVPFDKSRKIKITLMMGINDSIYIETIQLIDS